MASRKSQLYNVLKEQGWKPSKHFRDYTIAELEQVPQVPSQTAVPPEEPPPAEFFGYETVPEPEPAPEPQAPQPKNEKEMAGERLNTKAVEDVIRVDEQGREWLQEEVPKPAYPKPRGRRVLQYTDTGTEKRTTRVGNYIETFEVPGSGPGKASEVKITLPSYQVGIYRDKRFPFKVYTYNGKEGFDLFDVQDFYGGSEMVPSVCKRIYISNTLCYDIRSVVLAIKEEFRQQQLTRRLK